MFVGKLKAIKNTIKFSHLYIFQLRPWPNGLGSPDLDSKPDFFDFLIFNFLLLLQLFHLLLQHLHLLAFKIRANTPNYIDLTRQCNFSFTPATITQAKPSSNKCTRMISTYISINRVTMILVSSIICTLLLNSSARVTVTSINRARVISTSSTTYGLVKQE